jgi:16S rRNA G966 N2-methylase RsmD
MQIASHLPAIITLIGSHPVISIVAPTGSGKSVGVPAAVAAAGSRCFVTVPTRTSAISLAEYQKSLQLASDPSLDANSIIGYAAEGQIHYTPRTQIAYVTGGHARKKILSYFKAGRARALDFCDVLMVDEVHSGSLDTTIIISLWMVAYHAGVQVPRLVIASATPVPMIIEPTPFEYKVVLNHNRIDYTYLNREIELDDVARETATLAAQIHRTAAVAAGHILIFAPGSFEVETIAHTLADLLKDPLPDRTAVIVPAFGALQQDKINLIYKEPDINERKIVIATNIAEMSITIPDVAHVIDTMVEKRAETSTNGGLRLALHYISKDSAVQRAGRAGRTGDIIGVCHRMCTRSQYEKLEDHRPAEIDRVPIYDVIMELLDVGLHPTEVLRGINPQRITMAIQMLTKLKMVQTLEGDLQVTPSGHFAPNFQLSVQNAAFLWQWFKYEGLRFSPKIIAAARDLYGLNFDVFEIDESSEFSSLTPFQMAQVSDVYAQENLDPRRIIDATANVGGDSINFMRLYPHASLRSIEINPKVAHILRRNFANLNLILGTNLRYDTTAINMSARDYLAEDRSADLIFFDPPWGGRAYKELETVPLELDGQSLGSLIRTILDRGMTSLVIVKAPSNVDLDQFQADLGPETEVRVYDILNEITRETSYKLLCLNGENFGIESKRKVTPVPLVPAGLPPFGGIVTAALIDSYGPPYFYFPRQRHLETREGYNRSIEAHKQKYFNQYAGANDLETALNLWNDLMAQFKTIDPSQRALATWARTRSLNLTKIKELLHVIRQGVKSANRLGYQVKIGPLTTQGVMAKARPMLRLVYADSTLIRGDGTKYFNPVTREQFRLDDRNTVNQMIQNPPLGVVALSTIEIKTTGGSFRLVSFGIDTDKDGLGRPITIKAKAPRGANRVVVHHRPPALSATYQAEIESAADLMAELMLGSGPAGPPLTQVLGSWLRNEDQAQASAADLRGASAASIVDLFRRHLVQYPLRRRYRSLEEAQNSFAALTHYEPNWDSRPYIVSEKLDLPLRITFESPGHDQTQFIRLPNDGATYARIDWLVDYFIESSRIHCSRKGKKSPFGAWSEYGSYVERAVQGVLTRRQDLTLDALREQLYADKSVPECPHEKSSFLRSLFELLGIPNPRIFDGSAGWGDRLVAAMSIGAQYYVGIDPNQASQPGFKAMVESLGSLILPDDAPAELHARYSVLPLSMPDAILPELATPQSFDIAFLSPPSFDSEVYSNDVGQSVARWADETEWYLNFMHPTLARCWELVRPGGYFIVQSILINRIAPYIEATFADAFYCGPISVEVSTRNKPMWIWCKVESIYLTPKQQHESMGLKEKAQAIMARPIIARPTLTGLRTPESILPGLGPGGQFDLDLGTLGPDFLRPQPSTGPLRIPTLPGSSLRPPTLPGSSLRPPTLPGSSAVPMRTPTLPGSSAVPMRTPTLPGSSLRTPTLPGASAVPLRTPTLPESSAVPMRTPTLPGSSAAPLRTPTLPGSSAVPLRTPTLPESSLRTPTLPEPSTKPDLAAAASLLDSLGLF